MTIQLPDEPLALVARPLLRTLFDADQLENLTNFSGKAQTKEAATLPVGLTVQYKGVALDTAGAAVSVFVILRSLIGREEVKKFSQEYEGCLFVISDTTRQKHLTML